MRPRPQPQEDPPVWADRVLGRYEGQRPGPVLISIGGIHGNEPAGIFAARRVLADLERHRPPMRGRFHAVAGNLAALERGERYVERDLNRIWNEDELRELRASDPADDSFERREVRGLLGAIEEAARGEFERVMLLDLHSTSGDGPPWVVIGDTLQNRDIAFSFDIPVILGLEENVEGTLLGYAGERGHVSIGLEGGRHDDPRTARCHEAAIWLTLVAAGMLEEAHVPGLEEHRRVLREATRGMPGVVEMRYRYGIEPNEQFRMEPGFRNFDPVERGQLMAWSAPREGRPEEPVYAPQTGILLLPRYQGQGADGFFVARRVRPVWLELSARLRRLGAERFLSWLPGVRALRKDGRALAVDRRVARFLAVQIFHLFGYRRRRSVGSQIVFSRRVEGEHERRSA